MSDILITQHLITAVVLAGGKARRMGGQDKGLCLLNGKVLIQYVLERLAQQVNNIVINANRNHEIYARFSCPVIADEYANFCGPLAGIASCMHMTDHPLLLCSPCDTPYLPSDLVKRLYMALVSNNAKISVAHDGERLQPVFALIKTELHSDLHHYLLDGNRKIDQWYQQHPYVPVDFSDNPKAFYNINSPDDIQRNEQKLKS